MTLSFRVRNFERFQHYKERTPPWIKLYNELLDDYHFALLPDASKAHLIAIWLLASRADNHLPLDPEWIARRISATEAVDLERLRTAGFIEPSDGPTLPPPDRGKGASILLATCKQDASPEREGEAETEGETEEDSSDPPVADADASMPVSSGKKNYPERFEEFWRDYPTDALMSKKSAFAIWRRLSVADRDAAFAALPAFRAHCAKDLTYRPVHAERFLSQRRFDGFNERAAPPPAEDAGLRAQWGGNAEPLVDAIGAAKFAAWFSGATFEARPPAIIRVEKPFAADWIRGHYAADLRRLYGDVRVEVSK